MIISFKHKFIFFAIPKTATHSFRRVLRPHLDNNDWEQCSLFEKKSFPVAELARQGHGHLTAAQIYPFLPPGTWESFFKFCAVRNPYDRFVSLCFFYFRNSARMQGDPLGEMKRAISENRSGLFSPQHLYLTDDSGRIAVDRIARCETLQKDFDGILDRIGLPRERLQTVNASRHAPYRDYYDEELREMVHAGYARDFDLFGYPAGLNEDTVKSLPPVEKAAPPVRKAPVFRKKNLVNQTKLISAARLPELRFTVSIREIHPGISLLDYLKIFFIYLNIDQIESVFGFTDFPSLLYGGRPFSPKHSLNEDHLAELENLGINLSLNLTNHFFNEPAYEQTRELLERHHKPGNSIICVSDELAGRLKRDFPDYTLKASIIKNLNTREKVGSALEQYDEVVVPMDRNDDDAFLESLPEKERIILFGNATCAYTCPARTCFRGFSEHMQGLPVTSRCSRKTVPRPDLGMVYFDLGKLRGMGFTRFKFIPTKLRPTENLGKMFDGKVRL
jgi:Sulfotransferase family